jgi:superoxide dismutase
MKLKFKLMKTSRVLLLTGLVALNIILISFSFRKPESKKRIPFVPPKGCVFRTVMGEENSDSSFRYKTPEKVDRSMTSGLSWIIKAQNENGGWGAGDHNRQNVMNPHQVETDPATTAMVALALLRSGSTFTTGAHSKELTKALNHLLEAIEGSKEDATNITTLTGTQIQIKLGANIDVILTTQFLSNALENAELDAQLKSRIEKNLNTCVRKIERAQESNGSISGSGWAGVLQSSFATNALESAQTKGAVVDDKVLAKSREFQKSNYDAKTGDVNTDLGAGIMLYSVTGSARASAKEARKVKEELEEAKRDGRLEQNAPVTAETLEKIGYAKDEATKYSTAYEVYESAKVQAQRSDVMDGFGNNGGEEFLSYLQTGESLIIGKDEAWKKWYDNVSGRILNIQNDDGSWNGHHCITSPVFCTATCLLILSVNNDIDKLILQGKK